MSPRHFAAAFLAAASLTFIAAPAATAQEGNTAPNLDEELINEIENLDCETLEVLLKQVNDQAPEELLTENTTRTELARGLQAVANEEDQGLEGALIIARVANFTADRALECGIVEEDPTTPGFDSPLSSESSTQLGDLASLAAILS